MESTEFCSDILEAIRRMQKLKMKHPIKDLNEGEHFFLHILNSLIQASNTDSVYVSTISRELNISGPAVSKMLRNLEAKQMIRRETDISDRRNTFVSITDKGRIAKEEADAYVYGFFSKVYEKVGKDNLDKFRSLLKMFCDAAIEVYKTYDSAPQSGSCSIKDYERNESTIEC